MNSSREIPWLRIFVEGTAIVLSILLAFAIDAWWTERLERIDEREELNRLQTEFSLNRDRLVTDLGATNVIDVQIEARDASLRLYEILNDARDEGAATVDVSHVLIQRLLHTPTFEAYNPVFNGLIRSGRIEIIQSEVILTAVSVWERAITNTSESELDARQFVNEQLLPALIDTADIGHILLNQRDDTHVEALDPEATTTVDVDNTLIELVAKRYLMTSVSVRLLGSLNESAARVLDAIAESLDE